MFLKVYLGIFVLGAYMFICAMVVAMTIDHKKSKFPQYFLAGTFLFNGFWWLFGIIALIGAGD